MPKFKFLVTRTQKMEVTVEATSKAQAEETARSCVECLWDMNEDEIEEMKEETRENGGLSYNRVADAENYEDDLVIKLVTKH